MRFNIGVTSLKPQFYAFGHTPLSPGQHTYLMDTPHPYKLEGGALYMGHTHSHVPPYYAAVTSDGLG